MSDFGLTSLHTPQAAVAPIGAPSSEPDTEARWAHDDLCPSASHCIREGRCTPTSDRAWRGQNLHDARLGRRRQLAGSSSRSAGLRAMDERGRAPSSATWTWWTSHRFVPSLPRRCDCRRGRWVLVDELAHRAPDRQRGRWQDVTNLLDAGIDVLTSTNVANMRSVRELRGAHHRRRASRGRPR